MSLPIGEASVKEAASPSDVSSLMMASESSDAETVVSDIPLDAETPLTEDSLNLNSAGNSNLNASPGFCPPQPRSSGLELTRRLREIAASMPSYETDTSEASSAPPPQRPHRRRKKMQGGSNSNDSNLSAMEEELRDLERRLEMAGSSNSPRGKWETEGLRESLSTELFGNFTDNEKVCFSYENLARHAALAAVLSEQDERYIERTQVVPSGAAQPEDSNLVALSLLTRGEERAIQMPAPVESAIKRMYPMRSNAPHERYSPKPTRKATAVRRQNSSSPSTPTSENPSPRSPFFVTNREESVSMPPMGVTSMWIPATTSSYSSLSRKVFLRRQSSGGGGGNSNEMILPSKADLGDGLHG